MPNESGRRYRNTAYFQSLPKWKQLILDEEELFILRYFGPDSEQPKILALQDFHRDLLNAALYERRALILYPAAHGKTTLISTICPLLELCRDPNVRITGIFKNDTDAQGIGQALQAEMIGNERLIADFGPFQPEGDKEKSFAFTRFSIAKRTRRSKEPTVALFGAQSRSALGHRSDWTFCDDIVHDQNAATPERRAKLKEWFMQGPATQGELADARLTVVGTRFDPEDLYGDLLEMTTPDTGKPLYEPLQFDAIVDDDRQTTLWPERWPWLRLMERKAEMGTLDFNKRYRNRAVDKSRLVFREEFIQGGYIGNDRFPGCLDRTYKAGDLGDNWRVYAGFDPAVGRTKSAKFCVHCVLAVGSCKEHDRCYWIVDVSRDQLTLPQQVDLILSKHQEYRVDFTKVEANSYQAGLVDSLSQKMKDTGLALRIEAHQTTRVNKIDPEIGVAAMAPYFEKGLVHIPWADEFSRRRMKQLRDELIEYPGRYTDSVMALWFAWLAAQEEAPRFRSFNRLTAAKSVWGKSNGRKVVRNPYYAT